MNDPMRNAPVMLLVSAKEGGTSFIDGLKELREINEEYRAPFVR